LDILRYNKIDTELLYAGDPSFWDRVRKCDLFIFQWIHRDYYRQIAHSIIPIIENHLGIRCFPNSQSSLIYDDKIREYYLLKTRDFPMIRSWIFYDISNALRFIEQAQYPLLFKLKSGAGSRMVRLIQNKSVAKRYINLMFQKGVSYQRGLPGRLYEDIKSKGLIRPLRINLGKIKLRFKEGRLFYDEDWQTHKNYILLQKFLSNNSYDTRVVIIGNRAFAFQRHNAPNDFRASGSDHVTLEPNRIDLSFVEIAFRISRTFGFDSMAYDFLYDENRQPAIAEISYVFGSEQGSTISRCPGFWDEKMNWHEGRMNVAFCILSRLLPKIDLRMPEHL